MMLTYVGGKQTYAVTKRLVDRLRVDLLDVRHVDNVLDVMRVWM